MINGIDPIKEVFIISSVFWMLLGAFSGFSGKQQALPVHCEMNLIELNPEGGFDNSQADIFDHVFDVELHKSGRLTFHSAKALQPAYEGLEPLLDMLRPLPKNVVLVRLFIEQGATAQPLLTFIQGVQQCGVEKIEYMYRPQNRY
jgi:hypothetical protein